MSDIVLSSATRTSLLAAQDTASLLATTQQRLATGKKVNSALDSPVNYFTAAGLDSRASDINNVLDSISNGIQVIQAANTGITSIQKLVDSAKSVANQALQTAVGYSSKSSVTSAAITGATASNLLGTAYTNNTVAGTVVNNNLSTPAAITASTLLVSASNSDTLATTPANNSTITVNGKTITFSTASTTSSTDASGNVTLGVGAGSTLAVSDVLSAIDSITGAATASTVAAGKLTLSTGTTSDLTLGGTALSAFGLTAGTTARTPPSLSGLNLKIASTDGGTATNLTFGTGAGQVSTLNQLNDALAGNNLTASIDTSGTISITTTNDHASATVGAITGTAAGSGKAFNGLTASTAVKDTNSQSTRDSLIRQYNGILDQITTTAQDASFNGVNLLNGDQLKLVFNETGKSTLNLTGVTFNPGGLGLTKLGQGGNAEFKDNASVNKVLDTLNDASTTLRSQSSTFGSNLSVVQTRQSFNKNLINVLQTGSANLVNADLNEEAANSQALTTRQSLAVSSLSLANQSQQSVLQLLR